MISKDIRPTKEQRMLGEEDGWNYAEVRRGYTIFQDRDNDFQYVARIDVMGTFSSDEDAVKQAKRDGFKFLKVNKKDIEDSSGSITKKNVLDCSFNRDLLNKKRNGVFL